MTILLTPFMSCSAKLPIYAVFSTAFFPDYAALVMIALYVFGILTAILCGLIFKHTLFKGQPVPFVMELPNYRLPSSKSVLRLIYDKAKDFVVRAFTVIFLATLVIWFLQTFDTRFNVVDSQRPEYASRYRPFDRAGIHALGLQRLADFHRADYRIHSQRSSGQHSCCAHRHQYRYPAPGAFRPIHSIGSSSISGIHPAVYSLRCSNQRSQAGNGQWMACLDCGGLSNRCRLDHGFPAVSNRQHFHSLGGFADVFG